LIFRFVKRLIITSGCLPQIAGKHGGCCLMASGDAVKQMEQERHTGCMHPTIKYYNHNQNTGDE